MSITKLLAIESLVTSLNCDGLIELMSLNFRFTLYKPHVANTLTSYLFVSLYHHCHFCSKFEILYFVETLSVDSMT